MKRQVRWEGRDVWVRSYPISVNAPMFEALARSPLALRALCMATAGELHGQLLAELAAAGVPATKIIFAGVGKTRAEMAYALAEGILGFNVESEPELDALSEVAAGMGATARIAIRVNPDVDAKTHAKISTGKAENKFGVPFEDAPRLYAKAAKLPGIAIAGVHMHIGSQITDLAPFRDAFRLMRDLALELRQRQCRQPGGDRPSV